MQRYTFSGTEVLLGILVLSVLTGLVIHLIRRRLHRTVAPRPKTSIVMTDVFAYSSTVHGFSLCAALFISFLTLNWTEYNVEPIYDTPVVLEKEILVNVPPTTQRQPPPPAPPPPIIEPVAEPDAPSVEQQDQSVTEMDPVLFEAPVIPKRPVVTTPPPPPPPPPPREEPPLLFVERMPVFGDACRQLTGTERKQCSDRTLLQFVQSRVRYPAPARNNSIEGTVVVRFVVETDGSVSGIEAVRRVPGGCTEEALAAVRAINESTERFTPGIQSGRPVRVVFNLPVKFALQH